MRFTNKTVFITGAAGGIGRQTGLSFAKEGANVAVSDLDFDMASRVAKEIKSAGGNAEPFKLDVTCLLYTSPSPRDLSTARMPSSA